VPDKIGSLSKVTHSNESTAALRLAAVVESSDDAIISQALDGTIETWNAAAERLFGYARTDAIGRPIDLIIPDDCREEQGEVLARVLGGATVHHFDTTALKRDATRVAVSLTISPVFAADGALLGVSRIIRDVSGRANLEREALRLAAIVNSSEDAIVSKNLDGIVQTWNHAAERMFGYAANEIIGKSIRLIIPADRMSEEDSVLERIRAGVAIEHFETVRQRKDGSLIEISLSVSPIRAASGRVIGASKIVRDITAQRRLARALEEANRVKDEFLATLSHELRTPLNAVLGYTRMLRNGQISEDRQGRAIDIIERNAKVLSQLVGDVLDVSSIVTGKVTLKIGVCDLSALASSAVDMVKPSAEAKGIALRMHGAELPLKIHCDAARLQQVLWNLLSNAVKFTPRGGGIDTRVGIDDGMAKISVSDTGIGIKPEVLPYVFQRFWQADTTVTRQLGGLGLGLALARHFVELHGGTLTAESKGEGLGATFTITLPIVG
jgi:PAS domain S-box-containing protein